MNFDKRLNAVDPKYREEYLKLHYWVRKNKGKATYCINDPAHKANRYHWSNISNQYRWDLDDFEPLCPSCHSVKDGMKSIMKIKSKNNSSRAIPILMVFNNGSWIKFNSAVQAAGHLNILPTSIANCLKKRSTKAGTYCWRYIGETF